MIGGIDLLMLRKLREEISGRQKDLTDHMMSGRASDHADYRYRVGQYKALSDMLEWCQRINDELTGPEKKGAA